MPADLSLSEARRVALAAGDLRQVRVEGWGAPAYFDRQARVDLKSDRAARRLRVLAAYPEPGADSGPMADASACCGELQFAVPLQATRVR